MPKYGNQGDDRPAVAIGQPQQKESEMEVVEKSADRLIVQESRGWFLPLFGGLFLITGIVVLFLLAQTRTIECTRLEPQLVQCDIETSFLGLPLNMRRINGFQFAFVAESPGSDGEETYQVVLTSLAGETPLTAYFSSGYEDKQGIADQLNGFVADQSPEAITVRDRPGFFNYLFGLIFMGLGVLLIIIGLQRQVYTLDRMTNAFIYTRRGLFRRRDRSYPLDEIDDVYLEGDGDMQRIVLAIAGGADVPLTMAYTSGRESKEQVVQAINDFLLPETRVGEA
jgi:hypothetical protein